MSLKSILARSFAFRLGSVAGPQTLSHVFALWVGVIALSFASITFAGASDTVTVLHAFGGSNPGNDPDSLIQASDGNFYGTTYLPDSIVFKVTPSGQFTTLYKAPNNGGYYGGVVEGPDGFLYVNAGTIFRI